MLGTSSERPRRQVEAIGHSRGGHLALHLLVAHPERLLGVVCIDPMVRSSTETAGLIPGARVAVVSECGHFPWLERSGAVCEAVGSFIDELKTR